MPVLFRMIKLAILLASYSTLYYLIGYEIIEIKDGVLSLYTEPLPKLSKINKVKESGSSAINQSIVQKPSNRTIFSILWKFLFGWL